MTIWRNRIATNRRCTYTFFGVAFLTFWVLFLQTSSRPDPATALTKAEYVTNVDLKNLLLDLKPQSNYIENSTSRYLVYSSQCKIPSLDPFNTEVLPFFEPVKYKNCSNKHLLTYVTKKDNVATLHLDHRYVNEYSPNGVHCCYSTITRDEAAEVPDLAIDASPCIEFFNSTNISGEVVLVICKNSRSNEVYKNVHAVITINDDVDDKIKQFKETAGKEHLSVLFVGIDSISRLNLARSMPNTHNFLKDNGWIEFKGYNKIADNTFPNLMGILTGMNDSTVFKICDPRILGNLDKCEMIWFDYRRLGFVTAYAEDEMEMNTFNLLKKGFKSEPTDFYFLPYTLAAENHLDVARIDSLKYCTGPETAGERILNVAKDFASTFKNYPNFGFFWMNSFSHDDVNSASMMDAKIVDFLKQLTRRDVLENSIVIFISDHGFRFGTIMHTHTGWLEERLPFFYMSIPKWFKRKFPDKYSNLIKNTEKLTTPYDLYMTLQDVLVLSGKKYAIRKSSACPKCKSLFDEIEHERSCKDAAIERHWCTCNGYFTIPTKSKLVEEAAKFILNEVHKAAITTGSNYEDCTDFELKKIISAGISDTKSIQQKGNSYFLVTFQTNPHAVFQGTISTNVSAPVPIFKLEGSISRLDAYADHSWCADDAVLRKYCYCQGTIKYMRSVLKLAYQYTKDFLKSFVKAALKFYY